jgi:hypothetical protein
MSNATPNDEQEQGYVPEFGRDRDKDIALADLNPESLVGSYFRHDHDEDDEFDEGIVVGQVWVGSGAPYVIYLVEFRGQFGVTGYQRTVGLDQMLAQGWKFFDTDGWLTSASVTVRSDVRS